MTTWSGQIQGAETIRAHRIDSNIGNAGANEHRRNDTVSTNIADAEVCRAARYSAIPVLYLYTNRRSHVDARDSPVVHRIDQHCANGSNCFRTIEGPSPCNIERR